MSIVVKRTKIIEEPAKEGEFVTKFKLHQRVNVIDRRKNVLLNSITIEGIEITESKSGNYVIYTSENKRYSEDELSIPPEITFIEKRVIEDKKIIFLEEKNSIHYSYWYPKFEVGQKVYISNTHISFKIEKIEWEDGNYYYLGQKLGPIREVEGNLSEREPNGRL